MLAFCLSHCPFTSLPNTLFLCWAFWFFILTVIQFRKIPPQEQIQTCCIQSVESWNSITIEHPEMSVVTGEQAGFTGGNNMIAHNITTLQTCNVSQFAFAAFSGVAAGHKVNSSIGRYVSRKKLNLSVSKKHCLHASRAEETVTEYTVYLGHTFVFEISVGCRHCCLAKMEITLAFSPPRNQIERKKTTDRIYDAAHYLSCSADRFRMYVDSLPSTIIRTPLCKR